MPMAPFMERFRELGARETRSLTVTGRSDLPDGDYGFIELYCNEPDCDCRRVTIVVLLDPLEWQCPYLDPSAEQTEYSPVLLDMFKYILRSPDYVQRLKTHYQLFRAAVEEECANRNGTEQYQVGRRSKRRHGSKGSG